MFCFVVVVVVIVFHVFRSRVVLRTIFLRKFFKLQACKVYSEIAERSRKVGQVVIELGVNKEYKMIKIENKPRSKVFQNLDLKCWLLHELVKTYI